MGFFNETDSLLKTGKGRKFAVECVSNDFFLLGSGFSTLIVKCFCKKIIKFLSLEELQSLMKKEYVLKKKRFSYSKEASLT